MNMWGLYVNGNDIQRYIWQYTNYGMDWNGEESADDRWENYWDEAEGLEEQYNIYKYVKEHRTRRYYHLYPNRIRVGCAYRFCFEGLFGYLCID